MKTLLYFKNCIQTAVKPINIGLTAVFYFFNCQRRDYTIFNCKNKHFFPFFTYCNSARTKKGFLICRIFVTMSHSTIVKIPAAEETGQITTVRQTVSRNHLAIRWIRSDPCLLPWHMSLGKDGRISLKPTKASIAEPFFRNCASHLIMREVDVDERKNFQTGTVTHDLCGQLCCR